MLPQVPMLERLVRIALICIEGLRPTWMRTVVDAPHGSSELP